MQWIPIGRGSQKKELEEVIECLEQLWRKRYEYRIEVDENDYVEPYRLLLKHT